MEDEYRSAAPPVVKKSKAAGIGKFLWNNETKEFCGRDGASWGKVSLFYAIFYLLLGGFFVGMLAVFVQIMPKDVPTYYNEASVMASRGVNPGLGFRPQIDVEDQLIKYNPTISKDEHFGYSKYSKNVEQFLDAKYPVDGNFRMACQDGQRYVNELAVERKSCEFNYQEIFKTTECTKEKEFGFTTGKACILIKLNKVVQWEPKFDNATEIIVKCGGDHSVDIDNIKQVVYHSENHLNDLESGKISPKYFPFYSQVDYRAPFIFIQVDVVPNAVVNVVCKAYAKNIDNDDRMNRRGQTKFVLYVANISK